MEIKTKYKIGDKVCFYYHYEGIEVDGVIHGVRILDKDGRSEKDETGIIEAVYIQAKQSEILNEVHQFNKKAPKYILKTMVMVRYRLDNGEVYSEDDINLY